MPAKPGIAKNLIEADDIDRKAVADFIDSLLVKKICSSQPHKLLQANKVWMLASQARRNCPINVNSQMRSIFGMHDLLSIGHNVDLELTLPFLLGPVPWSLSTPERISTKTDKSILPHGLQSPNEPTLDWPCSAVHNTDVNTITTEHNSFSCHLHGSDGTSIQPGTKGRACWFCH